MENQQAVKPIISIIHFNDVYDIQPRGQLAGIVNFKAKVQDLRQKHPNSLLLFSGDAFSPSILSNVFQGQQMIHALNQLHIDVACFGNHEFDYQHDHTVKLSKQSNFPWLLGNIKLTHTHELLGHGKQYQIIQKNNYKIGIFGIAGQDWIGILSDYYEDQIYYIDHIEHSNKMVKKLKQQYKCNIIIALTHMRNGADLQYPEKVPGVDLVLGGHDHVILQEVRDKTPVIKSGCNFRNIGLIHIYNKQSKILLDGKHTVEGRNYKYDFHVLNVQKASEDKKDKKLEQYVQKKLQTYKTQDQVLGYTQIDLQTRFTVHRTQQTAYGNFIADLMRLYLDADISFANSGSIRNDCLLFAGPLKYSEISNIINEPLVLKALTGNLILQALQYSIQGLPNDFKGSFLHVSGLTFTFNSNLPKGSRIIQVLINQQKLDHQRTYSVAMYSYISHGGDGFDFLKNCPVLKDQVQTISMLNLLLKFFKNLNQQLCEESSAGQNIQLVDIPMLRRQSSQKITRITSLQSRIQIGQDGKKYACIKPMLQKRIVDVQQLMKQQQQEELEQHINEKINQGK